MAATAELVKVEIESREGAKTKCVAMFNPKELSLTRQASWRARSSNMDDPDVEHLTESQASSLVRRLATLGI